VHPPRPAWFCRSLAFVAEHFMRPLYFLRRLIPDRIADATIGRAERDALRVVSPAVVASRLRLVAETDCCDLLRNCSFPVLYLQASRDIAVKPRCLHRIQEVCPKVKAKVLDCSHMILQRRPAEAWAAISDFLVIRS
jgi:pimeloyl-ACP methyl ester carboxylesterase